MKRLVVLALALAACGSPSVPFAIALGLERDQGASQYCTYNSCTSVPLTCDAAIGIRVVDASDDSIVYLSRCDRIAGGDMTDLCSVGNVDLNDTAIPNTMVKIQVAVWPLLPGADTACPQVTYTLDGLPAEASPAPALGGQSYFQVGSAATATVILGCGDLSKLDNPVCARPGGLAVTSHVIDFDNLLSVTPFTSSLLGVSIGEPHLDTGSNAFVITGATPMDEPIISPTPTWTANPTQLRNSACVQVVEHGIQTTTTLRCATIDAQTTDLSLDGVLAAKTTLDHIQSAVGAFPPTGVVIGKVVDSSGQPVAGATVTASLGTVEYLSDDLTSTTDPGGTPLTSTGAAGAFVSLDASYLTGPTPTTWTASAGALTSVGTVIGGRVDGNVTVVLLQLAPP